jgi:hypothetical protein
VVRGARAAGASTIAHNAWYVAEGLKVTAIIDLDLPSAPLA